MGPAESYLDRAIPFIRPLWLRATRYCRRTPQNRLFNSKAPQLNLNQPVLRPQLPFLSTSFRSRYRPLTIRLLSTEQKADIKYQLHLGVYWTLVGWTLFAGAGAIYWTLRQHWKDQLNPSPEEWGYMVRYYWRTAKFEEHSDGYGTGVMDWGSIGTRYRAAAIHLEDHNPFDPGLSGLRQPTDYDRTVPGLDPEEMRLKPESRGESDQSWSSRIGPDITTKSEAWRRGYYEVMIGLAKGAEMRSGWMMHKITRKIFPPEHVKSADNPYPKPLPPGTPLEIPDISECEPAIESPDFHYKRILTTIGFNRKQRMDAGLAYASYLDHSGHHDLARDMLQWCLELAVQGLGPPSASHKPGEVINLHTAVIPASAPYVTPNVLETATALANHHARLGDITKALPIYLSVLRARQMAPFAPPSRQYHAQPPDLSLRSSDSVFRYLRTLPWDAQFPPPPGNGDDVYERKRADQCTEAALMTYVGELLFAKANKRREGLAWTQDALSLAESSVNDSRILEKERTACEQCIGTSLGNWKSMAAQLAQEALEAREGAKRTDEDRRPGLLSWLTRGGVGTGTKSSAFLEEKDWENEERKVQKRLTQFEEKKLNKTLSAMISGTSSWFVV